jgi:hypothetical protein
MTPPLRQRINGNSTLSRIFPIAASFRGAYSRPVPVDHSASTFAQTFKHQLNSGELACGKQNIPPGCCW